MRDLLKLIWFKSLLRKNIAGASGKFPVFILKLINSIASLNCFLRLDISEKRPWSISIVTISVLWLSSNPYIFRRSSLLKVMQLTQMSRISATTCLSYSLIRDSFLRIMCKVN